MRILVAHNYYQRGGGEDEVYALETRLLRDRQMEVVEYVGHNGKIDHMNRLAVALQTVWSRSSRRALQGVMADRRPDVAHFHNTFALISPSAYYACRDAGVPVVQTLHNYRLLCPAANLFRAGAACEDCLGRKVAWPGVLHACYRGSRPQTAVVASMLALHGWLGTWRDMVDVYVATNEFARKKFVEGGLPEHKIMVKPHFVSPDPGEREEEGRYALFVGRLSAEKGVRTLLKAWRGLGATPLTVVGDGPLLEEVKAAAASMPRGQVRVMGWRRREEVFPIMKAARFLVFPSVCYESFGLAVIEAFACGVPVIASAAGAAGTLVEHGRTGLHFTAPDADDLCAKVTWLWAHGAEGKRMGREARLEFERKYTAEHNFRRLMEVYRIAADSGRGRIP